MSDFNDGHFRSFNVDFRQIKIGVYLEKIYNNVDKNYRIIRIENLEYRMRSFRSQLILRDCHMI